MCQPESHSAVPQRKPRLSRRVVRLVLLAIIVLMILPSGMVYLWRTGHERDCRGHLKWFSDALMKRVSASRGRAHVPCAHFMDSSGRRMHSWRCERIEALDWEASNEYTASEFQYHYDEPWDSPRNATYQRISRCSEYYSCPVYAAGSRNASYLCVLGSRLWPVPRIRDGQWNVPWSRSGKEGGVLPGHGKAILLVEVVESDIPWTKPEDITLSEISSLLREDPSGERFRRRIRNVVVIDADEAKRVFASVQGTEVGKAFIERAIQILDPARDLEEIKKVVNAENAAMERAASPAEGLEKGTWQRPGASRPK